MFRISGGMFDYRDFYYDILKYIHGTLTELERKDILTWYKK
jgi:hypothetical protein